MLNIWYFTNAYLTDDIKKIVIVSNSVMIRIILILFSIKGIPMLRILGPLQMLHKV
jgi:hypothetical protein